MYRIESVGPSETTGPILIYYAREQRPHFFLSLLQGSKAAMKVISEADVVLALGTRLGPFGSLPQYGFDYWPKNAKIIQVSSDRIGAYTSQVRFAWWPFLK